ncbi:MAG: phosphatase [Thermobacillus sp. ZCTH02-B1]|uniref:HAD family hydrolase n=1 Tax=Thermobacillus sp. ZCTH02-B1 TaxID=1858795 RepID=UPI000B57E302|nr:HAD family hydrolase [Thermobacillus sp. ZCTH02-B1]OUM93786.1 MAG: phosphatase [Thermobacillus sp. ZCTH02-B1]
MIRAFIFDMDGVIIDSEPIHFEVDLITARHFGADMDKEDLERFVGMTNPEMWAIIRAEYGISHTVDEIIEYQSGRKIRWLDEADIEPIDGIRELLQDLRGRRIPTGLASSSPRPFIEAVLAKFGIRESFDCVISGEEVPNGKPAPDIYLEAAKRLGVPPAACAVLEDSRNGVLAAKRAGMYCIGFANPNSGNQDLSLADRVVSAIDEIHVEHLLAADGRHDRTLR